MHRVLGSRLLYFGDATYLKSQKVVNLHQVCAVLVGMRVGGSVGDGRGYFGFIKRENASRQSDYLQGLVLAALFNE